MHYATSSPLAIAIFVGFVTFVLILSFYLGRKAKSAQGYYAAHGQIHWFVNGFAFAGDYLSAASFLGICGMIAFFGYDGFLYSIGFLAGWVVALFVIAEPVKRLGKFTFADAMDSRFNSRGIKFTVAVATMVISISYLIPQMVGAGALIKPLLGLPQWSGILMVGLVVTVIVATAGMVSTTWVQFIKGSLLVIFCFILTVLILYRGLSTDPTYGNQAYHAWRPISIQSIVTRPGVSVLSEDGVWKGKPYLRVHDAAGQIAIYRRSEDGQTAVEAQLKGAKESSLFPVGQIASLPGGQSATGPLSPLKYISTLRDSTVIRWTEDKIKEADNSTTSVYYPVPTPGKDVLRPGSSPTFKGIRSDKLIDKLDFFSLMLALFCGTASLPHILIRYYTVKDQAAARKSTVVGIASIGFFYVLTLFLGLGAMTSGAMDVSDANMSAPLLARSFNPTLFAIISAIAFTTVLGTVSGLIMAGSGAVAHDLMENCFKIEMDDRQKVLYGKVAAVVLCVVAMLLGVAFSGMNVAMLVGWAFNIAASANLPSLVMLLFWPRTTKQGITAAVFVGMISSLLWVLLSGPCYTYVYHLDVKVHPPLVPFSQPALVTVPLGFVVLIAVSLLTPRPTELVGAQLAGEAA